MPRWRFLTDCYQPAAAAEAERPSRSAISPQIGPNRTHQEPERTRFLGVGVVSPIIERVAAEGNARRWVEKCARGADQSDLSGVGPGAHD